MAEADGCIQFTPSGVKVNLDSGIEDKRDIHKLLDQSQAFLKRLKTVKQKFHDVVLNVSGTKIKTHKVILISFSSYFRALLGPNMLEGTRKEIQLKDLDPAAVKDLIDFAYSGKITINTSVAQALLETANFLDVELVQKACCEFFVKHIDDENLEDIFQIGIRLVESCLCDAVTAYVCHRFIKTRTFLGLSLELLKYVLVSEDLTYIEQDKIVTLQNQEFLIAKKVLEYVELNIESRLSALPDLLSRIRLPILIPTDLGWLRQHPIVQRSMHAINLLDTAYNIEPAYRSTLSNSEDLDKHSLNNIARKNKSLRPETKKFRIRLDPFQDFDDHSRELSKDDLITECEYIIGMKLWFSQFEREGVHDARPALAGFDSYYNSGRKVTHAATFRNGDVYTYYDFSLAPSEVIVKVKIISITAIYCITFYSSEGRTFGPFGEYDRKIDQFRFTETCEKSPNLDPKHGFLMGFRGKAPVGVLFGLSCCWWRKSLDLEHDTRSLDLGIYCQQAFGRPEGQDEPGAFKECREDLDKLPSLSDEEEWSCTEDSDSSSSVEMDAEVSDKIE